MWEFFKKKEVVKQKTVSLKKDKWTVISNGKKSISVLLKDFSIDKFEIKYISNEETFFVTPKIAKIKLSGANQIKVYIKSIENAEVEISI